MERPESSDAKQPLLFRHTFTVPAAPLEKIKLRLRCVDAAAIWINGREVHRENLTAAEPLAATPAETITNPRRTAVLLGPDILRPGENLIAVALVTTPQRLKLDNVILDVVLEGLTK